MFGCPISYVIDGWIISGHAAFLEKNDRNFGDGATTWIV
jgi:hypothetical protein